MRPSRPIYIKDIKETKKNNVIIDLLDSSSSSLVIPPSNNYQLIHDYTESTSKGSSLLLNNNFYGALLSYRKSLSIAEKLRDNYRKNESKCNIGIANFYLGKINESITYIESCYKYINSICSFEEGKNDIKNLYLLCKTGANLCMCQLTMNSQYNKNSSIINNITDIISKEDDLNKQMLCVRFLNNIIFRVNSLRTNKNNNINGSNIYGSNRYDEENKSDYILNSVCYYIIRT